MNNKRIEYIDIAKGLLILLVVIGHVQQNEPFTLLKQFIYTFHMPAFFIISGILFDKSRTANKKFFPYVKKKIYTLIIPYFFFEILSGIVFYMAYSGNYSNIKGIIACIGSLSIINLPSFLFLLITIFLSFFFF